MKLNLSSLVELVGLAAIAVAAFATAWQLGLAVVGAGLIAVANIADDVDDDQEAGEP